jgi:hypothetical protein
MQVAEVRPEPQSRTPLEHPFILISQNQKLTEHEVLSERT